MSATIAELAAEYRRLWDESDALTAKQKDINARMGDIERDIREAMKNAGKVNDGDADTVAGVMRMTIRQKWRAGYEPDKWSDIVRWCVENGYDYLIQRRLSDAKVMDLVDNGISLPDGLQVSPYEDVDFRRL